jgi:hypothetical protein
MKMPTTGVQVLSLRVLKSESTSIAPAPLAMKITPTVSRIWNKRSVYGYLKSRMASLFTTSIPVTTRRVIGMCHAIQHAHRAHTRLFVLAHQRMKAIATR